MRILLLTLLLVGCTVQPTPLQTGAETTPPIGCIELRARTGDDKAC